MVLLEERYWDLSDYLLSIPPLQLQYFPFLIQGTIAHLWSRLLHDCATITSLLFSGTENSRPEPLSLMGRLILCPL